MRFKEKKEEEKLKERETMSTHLDCETLIEELIPQRKQQYEKHNIKYEIRTSTQVKRAGIKISWFKTRLEFDQTLEEYFKLKSQLLRDNQSTLILANISTVGFCRAIGRYFIEYNIYHTLNQNNLIHIIEMSYYEKSIYKSYKNNMFRDVFRGKKTTRTLLCRSIDHPDKYFILILNFSMQRYAI